MEKKLKNTNFAQETQNSPENEEHFRGMHPQSVILGTAGNDNLQGTTGSDTIYGIGGDDTIEGKGGADTIDGGNGNDIVLYNRSSSAVRVNLTEGKGYGGEAEGDQLVSVEGIMGSAYDDVLVGGASVSNTIYGLDGNDLIKGNGGADVIDGGIGNDRIEGNEGDDVINGCEGNDLIEGNGGDDVINGGAGNDSIEGNEGDDVINGGAGNDLIEGNEGADVINGSAGDDRIEGNEGADVINGGTGDDVADYRRSASAVNVNLTEGRGYGGDAEGDRLASIERIMGSPYDDVLIGAVTGNVSFIKSKASDTVTVGFTDLGDYALARLTNGGFVAVWSPRLSSYSSSYPSSSYHYIKAQRYDANGNALGSTVEVVGTPSSDYSPSVAGLTNGGFVVAWQSSSYYIKAQRYDANSTALGSTVTVATSSNNYYLSPSVAGLTNGGFVAVWSLNSYSTPSYYIIKAQRYDANGNALGSTVTVATSSSSYHSSVPSVAGLTNGGFVAVWSYGSSSYSPYYINAKTYDANGNALGSTVTVGTSDYQSLDPSVAGLTNGGFVAVWTSYSSPSHYIKAQRYDANGNALGSTVEAVGTPSSDYYPSVAGLTNGGFVVAWQSSSYIKAQRYDANSNALGSTVTVGNFGYRPSVAELTNDEFVILYATATFDDKSNRVLCFNQYLFFFTLYGNAGNDQLVSQAAIDILDGGEGIDTISYRYSPSGVEVNLKDGMGQRGDAEGDTFIHIENIIGSQYNDVLIGDDQDNTIESGGGSYDFLTGNGGSDTYKITKTATGGVVHITDFEIGKDFIDLRDFNGMTLFEQLDITSENTGSITVRIDNNHRIVLPHLRLGELSSIAFQFLTHTTTITETLTHSVSFTGSITETATMTVVPTITRTNIPTFSQTGTASSTLTTTATITPTFSPADTASSTLTPTAAITPTFSPTGTASSTLTPTATITRTDIHTLTNTKTFVIWYVPPAVDGVFFGTARVEYMIGGERANTVSYENSPAAVQVDLSAKIGAGGYAERDSLENIYNLIGSKYSDTLIGSPMSDTLKGMGGDDTLEGRAGADVIDGGAGVNTASYLHSQEGVKVDLHPGGTISGGDAKGDLLIQIRNICGSPQNDFLTGDDMDNTLEGMEGDDILEGGKGADVIKGGEGSDTTSYAGSASAVRIDLRAGKTISGGDAQGDQFESIENIIGSPYSDSLIGNEFANTLNGQGGDDTLATFGDDDTLVGGNGIDHFRIGAITLVATIEDFDVGYETIDFTERGIPYSEIQQQQDGPDTILKFGSTGKVILKNVQSQLLKEANFVLLSSLETWQDKLIRYGKIISGPVASVASTAIGIYLKQGLIKNVLYASNIWCGNRYIKGNVWVPENKDSTRPLKNRHGNPIKLTDVEGIKVFRTSLEEATCLQNILPHYYAENSRAIPINDHQNPFIYFGHQEALLKLDPRIISAIDFDIVSVRVFAKDNEILEQFECNLHMAKYSMTDITFHGNSETSLSPTRGVKVDVQPLLESSSPYSPSCTNAGPSGFYFMETQWDNPILQDPTLLQIVGNQWGGEGINKLIDLGSHREHYAQFKTLKETLGTEAAIAQMLAPKAIPETLLALRDRTQNTPPTTHTEQYLPIQHFFLASTLIYRLPALYGQTKYLMKNLAGVDVDQQLEKIDTTFYTSYGVESFSNQVGTVLKPSLILGGASVAYATSSDPVILMIAMSEPELGLSQDSSFVDILYYTVSVTTFIRTAMMLSQSAVVGGLAVKCAAPLLALQGANIASHIMVDGGFIAEDNQVLPFLQSTIGFITNSLGVAMSPSMPLKVLHGFEVVTQGVVLCQGMLDYFSENSEKSSDFYSEAVSENDTGLTVAQMTLIENDWL